MDLNDLVIFNSEDGMYNQHDGHPGRIVDVIELFGDETLYEIAIQGETIIAFPSELQAVGVLEEVASC